MDLALAIELDGDRTVLGIVDPNGTVLESSLVEPESGVDSAEAVGEALGRLRSRANRLDGELVACGVSVVEMVDPSGRSGFPVAGDVAGLVDQAFGIPVHVDTDGRAFALSEGWVGSAKGVDNYAALKIGASVSGGVVLDGRLLDGGAGRAGRIGHVIVVPDGRRCGCGAKGCLHAEVSVAAIESSTGRALTEPSYEVMRHVGHLVGVAAASVANLLDLKLVVCGGRVAREYASTMFLAAQEQLDASCRLVFSRGARLASARTPEPAGLVAAAAIGWRGRTGGPG